MVADGNNTMTTRTKISAVGGQNPTYLLIADNSGASAGIGAGPAFAAIQGIAPSGAGDGVDGIGDPTNASAFGVRGSADQGYGVVGTSSTGIDIFANGTGRILQRPLGTGAPSTGAHVIGEQVRDLNGALWMCTAGGTPGTWFRATTFETFPSGHRVFDGYTTPVSNGGVYGPITARTEVTTSGWTGQPTGVPLGAKAAWCAVQAYSPGVLTLFPDGAADPGGANYAGTGPNGQLNLLYMLVPLSAAGRFKIHAYFDGQVFVDVWGFQV